MSNINKYITTKNCDYSDGNTLIENNKVKYGKIPISLSTNNNDTFCHWKSFLDIIPSSFTNIDIVKYKSHDTTICNKWFNNNISYRNVIDNTNHRWAYVNDLFHKKHKINRNNSIDNDNPSAERVFKLRIYPDQHTKILYSKLFGINRVIKREVRKYINDYKKFYKEIINFNFINYDNFNFDYDNNNNILPFPSDKKIRSTFISDNSDFVRDRPWMNKNHVVYDFKDNAYREAKNEFTTAYKKFIKLGIVSKLKDNIYTKAKERINGVSFTIHKKHWNIGWWKQLLPKNLYCRDKRSKFKLPKKINFAARIQKTPDNKYYIILPQVAEELKESKENVFIIDPGFRTGLTGLNLKDNKIEELGVDMSKILRRKMGAIYALQGKISKDIDNNGNYLRHKKRYRMKLALRRAREKVKRLVIDYHKCCAKYICENFSTVLIPKLNFHKMKNISKRIKAIGSTLSLCKFVDSLKMKSKQYKNCNVIEVNEAYTSKTCSNCGYLNKELGRSKNFVCPNEECKYASDRDHNATKNILIRSIYGELRGNVRSFRRELGIPPEKLVGKKSAEASSMLKAKLSTMQDSNAPTRKSLTVRKRIKKGTGTF